ncbi:MAG: hypothetical protein ACI4GW_07185 [Lachnospiraceae bacterium]
MKKRIISMAMVATMFMVNMTGCGSKTFDVTSTAEISFNGYNGYGTCTLENEYEWINSVLDWYGDSINEMQQAKSEMELMDTVSYEIDKPENLSNGDTVTITVKIGSAADDYAFKLTGESITATVEGLEEVEEFDPFENISVVYNGFAPKGTATIKSESEDNAIFYEADKSTGLSNGDKITVTASSKYDMNQYAQLFGKVFSSEEKEFTVEGLASYASSIDEIPEDAKNKMLSQASDSIKADCASWAEGNSLKSSEFIGYYFLKNKEGFEEEPYNELYYVYKNTANMKGLLRNGDGKTEVTGEEVYYTFYRYSDIVLMPDGTCSVDLSSGKITDNRIESDYGYWNWFAVFYTFDGYKDLDSMFNDCITKKVDKYDYETTVKNA